MDYTSMIEKYLEKEIETIKYLDIKAINEGINLLEETHKNKKKIYIFGNGGSSATASHFANDFNKGVSEYIDIKFNFVCLNDNIATVMAIANDIGFEDVFSFQLQNKLEHGDIIMAISGSGNSPNILKAVDYAKKMGNKVIGLTGYEGGKLKDLSDVSLHVPVKSMQITEDVHMVFDHLIMSIFYKTLANKEHLKES